MSGGLPPGFDAIDLGELIDVIDALRECISYRVGTWVEEEGEREARDRADRVLERYRPAS